MPEFNYPITRIVGTLHKGSLPCETSLLNISSSNIIAEALKLSEDKKAYILRCYEIHGIKCDTEIKLPQINRSFSTFFNPHEIKTFCIPFDESEPIKETNILEE